MTRLTNNEKVMLTQAKERVAVTRTAAIDGIGAALRAMAKSALRPIRRAVVARQLYKLDDRMLADIGLQRWQIKAVADEAVGGERVSFPTAAARLFGVLARRVRSWHARRAAFGELMALDERMLRDIGINRGDIPAVVAGISRARNETADPLDAQRRWNRSRQAHKTLNGLDNRALNDIGFVRGDIDWVVEELAVRSLDPANANRTAHRAA